MMLALALAPLLFSFEVKAQSEVVAVLPVTAPGCDWAVKGREAAVADLYLDGKLQQNVWVFTEAPSPRVFLGALAPGRHELRMERNAAHSAAGCSIAAAQGGLRVTEFRRDDPGYAAIAGAPVLYARKNTIGRFSDVPLVMYWETIGGELQYTVTFSNEDGGTNTRALMARWGRTTDIEYVIRGNIIQGKEHKEVVFAGKREDSHPLLIPITDNNMVGDNDTSELRFQLAPVEFNAETGPRESMMPPWTYSVMTKEMIREGKLRPYGTVDGEKISDPRNYAYIAYRLKSQDGAINVAVRRQGSNEDYSSSLGRLDYAIARDGWVQTTVELPPGTRSEDIAEVRFECLVAAPEKGKDIAHSGTCTVGDAYFFLIGSPRISLRVNRTIPTGQSAIVVPRR